MNRIYQAKFVASKREGRMGVALDTYCQYFVRGIKKFDGARYEAKTKTWFFNAADYDKVRALVIESFESPIRIISLDGSQEIRHLPDDHFAWTAGLG